MASSQSDRLRRNAEAEIARLEQALGGQLGVAALHIESGSALAYNDDVRFPVASTVKILLALTLLSKAERGDFRLTDMFDVEPSEFAPLQVLGAEFPHPGVRLSLLNLLETTITHSDNTATDALYRIVGGTEAVARVARSIGVEDFEVRRTMREALAVLHEIDLPAPEVSIREALSALPAEQLDTRNRAMADGRFHHDRRDHGTPRDMMAILRVLWSGELVSLESRDVLVAMMERTRARERIGGRLPAGVRMANKTGSGAGTANDVGFLFLPENRGTVAIVLYSKGSPAPAAERDRVLADAARLIYDYFVISSPV